jgi:formate hydrogenlyase subunit 3/multisubunit Na+/H+ antiporter MnhD subunit
MIPTAIPAALLVVLIPLFGSVVAFSLRRWPSAEILFAALICLGGGGLLVALPAEPFPVLPGTTLMIISPDAPLDVLGRTLRIQAADRVPLGLLFITSALLFLLSWRAPQGRSFIALGLIVLLALVGALIVRPFLYAALAFEMAAAFAALMIQAERGGERSTLGALRYLSAVTLAMPLLLIAGWFIDSADTTSVVDLASVEAVYGPAIVLLLASFGLLMGAIPIFNWVHPVTRDAPPLVAAFLAAVGVGAFGFLLLNLLQAYEWLRLAPLFTQSLIAGGLVLIAFGGLLAWAQQSFARLMACAVFVEIGCLLLNLGDVSRAGVEAITFSLPARALALGAFGLGVWRLRMARNSDDFAAVRGLRDRWAGLAVGIGGLSLAGLPGTLGFVSRWLTMRAYGFGDPESIAPLIFAQVSVAIGLMRGLRSLFQEVNVVEDQPTGDVMNTEREALILFKAERAPATEPAIVGLVQGAFVGVSWLRQQLDDRLPIAISTAVLVALGVWPENFAWLAKAAADAYAFLP